MTDLKFEILKLLYNVSNRTLRQKDIFHSVSAPELQIYYALEELCADNLIKSSVYKDSFSLEPKGSTLYEQEQENRKKYSAQKRRQMLNIVISIATLIATFAVSEKFIEFMKWLINKL